MVLLAGCSGGGVGQVPLTTADLSAVKLQFAVGTVSAFAPAGDGGMPIAAVNFIERSGNRTG